MLVSGNLTLPNSLTPEQFLAEFFNVEFGGGGDGYVGLDVFSDEGRYIVSTLFDSLPGIANGSVELNFASSPVRTTTHALPSKQAPA